MLCPVCGQSVKRVNHTLDGRTVLSCGDACWDFNKELMLHKPIKGIMRKDARVLGTGLYFKKGEIVSLLPATNIPHKPDEPHKWFIINCRDESYLADHGDCFIYRRDMMGTVLVEYTFVNGCTETAEIDISFDLENDIEEKGEELAADVGCAHTDFEIIDGPGDFSNFTDLSEYAEYAEKIEEHGEAYALRYDDIGEFDFDDSYEGCWDTEEDFAHNLIDNCYNVPDFIYHYIDWEKWTRDIMFDYSAYEGNEGIHIFRD